MKVRDVMTRPVEFIAPDATVQAAAQLMGELDVGSLPVGGPSDLQGVLSDRDILFRVVADGEDVRASRVRDVMSRATFSCQESDSLEAALDQMSVYHVRRLPVTNAEGVVTGWITLSDIAGRLMVDSGVVGRAVAELNAQED